MTHVFGAVLSDVVSRSIATLVTIEVSSTIATLAAIVTIATVATIATIANIVVFPTRELSPSA